MNSKDICKRILKGELSFYELKTSKVIKNLEEYYYDFYCIEQMMNIKLSECVTDRYFSLWLLVVSEIISMCGEEYEEISSFLESYSSKRKFSLNEVKFIYKYLEDLDYRLTHPNYLQDYISSLDDLIIVMTDYEKTEEYSDSCYYKIFVLDKKNKTFFTKSVNSELLKIDLNYRYFFICDEEEINLESMGFIYE